jgi:hypothetical protein
VRRRFRKALTNDRQASEQQEEHTGEVQQEDSPIERQMARSRYGSNKRMKRCQAGVKQKEVCVVGVQCGSEEFLNGGQIDGHVLDTLVIAMNGHRSGCQPKQEEEIPQPMGLDHRKAPSRIERSGSRLVASKTVSGPD